MAEIELVSASALDYDAFVDLQRRAFAELLSRRGISDAYLCAEYFQWKFTPPRGEAKIAFVRDGSEMIAANAMIPVGLRKGDLRTRGWQSCDTATSPKARGKGYFLKCLEALRKALEPGDVFFGFPNENSMRGFEKIGWRELTLVHTWVAPLPRLFARGCRNARLLASPGPEHDALAAHLARQDGPRAQVVLEHDASFLSWRYFRHPLAQYESFALGGDDAPKGSAIVRFTDIERRRVALVMQLSATTISGERALLRHIETRAVAHRTPWLVFLDSALPAAAGLGAGLLPVWSRLLPKRQILMGAATDAAPAPTMLEGPWRVQTGDWDVF